jgi:O-phosphoseryl-tRNA(Cys) synthetase
MATVVKPTISVPNEAFAQIERARGEVGLSRSEFFTRAALAYAKEIQADDLTARIDRALENYDPTESWVAERSRRLLAEAE